MAIRKNASALALGTAFVLGQGHIWAATNFDFIEAAVEEPVEAITDLGKTVVSPVATPTATPPAAVPSVVADANVRPTVVERYPNGKTKIRRNVALDQGQNFVSHGEYTVHSPDGAVIGGGQYHLGRKTGEWTRVFKTPVPVIARNAAKGFTGPYNSVAIFKDDQLHGDWTITDAKKRPVVLWQFSKGEREGQWLWFNPDGTTRKQVTYKNGSVAGDIVASDGEEQLKVLVSYIEGRELTKHLSRYSPRQVKSEGFLLKPTEVSSVSVDWWSGEMTENVVSQKGELSRHGEWRFYHANGKLQLEGTYDRGKETGRFVWYHENGQKSSEGDYYAGLKQGRWEGWYASGARKTAGVCVDGKHDGIWMSWHENGMPKLQAKYEKGQMVASTQWNEKGKRVENIASRNTEDRVSQRRDQEEPVNLQ